MVATRGAATSVFAAALLGACAAPRGALEPAAPLSTQAAQAAAALPPGRGREILAASCTGCHDLGGIEPFRGYYDAARWRRLVDTMIAHGAKLDEAEIGVLVDYLAEHFGTSPD